MGATRAWSTLLALVVVVAAAACRGERARDTSGRQAAGEARVAPSAVAAAPPAVDRGGGDGEGIGVEPALAALAAALPETRAPFVAGPLVATDGFVRRRYRRGDDVHIEITIAPLRQTPAERRDWMEASRPYPPVALDVPAGSASGFYACTGGGTEGACDLHVQLDAGYHVEVMGGGHARRADLDALMRQLPLRALAARAAP